MGWFGTLLRLWRNYIDRDMNQGANICGCGIFNASSVFFQGGGILFSIANSRRTEEAEVPYATRPPCHLHTETHTHTHIQHSKSLK